MSHISSILIVDSNEAFATILKEGIEQAEEFQATVISDGNEALQMVGSTLFDLVIVDMGLTDPDGADLARTLREQAPDLRLMLIPLMGEDLSPSVADLDVQGVLTKPFFFPELPGIISGALNRNVGQTLPTEPPPATEPPAAVPATSEETPSPPPPAPAIPSLTPVEGAALDAASAQRLSEVCAMISSRQMQHITQAMSRLTQDVGADVVILTCSGGLISHAGRLSVEEAESLAQIVGENWRTSARVAKILGQEQLRFEQSVEGGEHMFYSLALTEDIILSAALSTTVPLGMIRHSAKSTADALRRVLQMG